MKYLIIVLLLSGCMLNDKEFWRDGSEYNRHLPDVVESETGCLNLKREPVPCEEIEPDYE